jgi:putative FmdB family regulatory protein
MPVYEFICNACKAPLSVFVRSISSPVNAKCERCGSQDVRRTISKFAVLRSGSDGMMDEDAMMRGFDENDPRAMADWARRMQSELGEDMGSEFDSMVDQMASGQLNPNDIGMGGGDDFGDSGGLDDF